MFLPVGKSAIMTRNDEVEQILKNLADKTVHRQKKVLKAAAEAFIKKFDSLNDQSKEISKKNSRRSY